jgi:hypothetical protein
VRYHTEFFADAIAGHRKIELANEQKIGNSFHRSDEFKTETHQPFFNEKCRNGFLPVIFVWPITRCKEDIRWVCCPFLIK